MIALWMVYALVIGALIALVCTLLERLALPQRLPTRGIWAAGMSLMLLVGGSALRPPSEAERTEVSGGVGRHRPGVEGAGDAASQRVGAGDPWVDRFARLRTHADRLHSALAAQLGSLARRLTPWDRPLLLLWAIATAFLAGVGAHAALEGRRLRHGLQRREVDGTSVHLTDAVGPAAIGFRHPAILLPRWMLELEGPALRLVLRHEREHLAARDPLLLLAALAAVVVLPWQLPLWYGWRRLQLAVEVDCDRRVLRAHPDVRGYAQLLLLAGQRAPSPGWASRPVVTVVAALRPRASQLNHRILQMTQLPAPRPLLRAARLALGVALVAAAALALPIPHPAEAQGAPARDRVILRLTSVGTTNATEPMSVLIYGTGRTQVGIGTAAPSVLSDTLRLDRLPALTADLTDGDLHVEIRSPGTIRMGGTVTGGPARELSGSGRHLVFKQGGAEIVTR